MDKLGEPLNHDSGNSGIVSTIIRKCVCCYKSMFIKDVEKKAMSANTGDNNDICPCFLIECLQ